MTNSKGATNSFVLEIFIVLHLQLYYDTKSKAEAKVPDETHKTSS